MKRFSAGASALQLYTGMVYNGPLVIKDIKRELIATLKKEKLIISKKQSELILDRY